MRKYRQYRRELTKQQYKNLQHEYQFHLKDTRFGCLTTADRKFLLAQILPPNRAGENEKRNWETDFWHRIRKKAQSSLFDLRLLCDICSEDMLKDIFASKDERGNFYNLTVLFRKLFPASDIRNRKDDEEWRKQIAEDIVCNGLLWYVNSDTLSTEAHRRAVFEVLDAITLTSSGRRRYRRTPEGAIEEVVSK